MTSAQLVPHWILVEPVILGAGGDPENGHRDARCHLRINSRRHIRSESSSVIWPAKRAWFVATKRRSEATFIGGSKQPIETLTADRRPEA
jgi:hypothetical protein